MVYMSKLLSNGRGSFRRFCVLHASELGCHFNASTQKQAFTGLALTSVVEGTLFKLVNDGSEDGVSRPTRARFAGLWIPVGIGGGSFGGHLESF